MNALDKLIGVYETRLAKLRQLAELIGSDEEFAQEVVVALTATTSQSVPATTPLITAGSQVDRLQQFLGGRPGEWVTKKEITAGTGIQPGSLAPLLSRNTDLIEVRPHPTNPRMKQWRLRAAEDNHAGRAEEEEKL